MSFEPVDLQFLIFLADPANKKVDVDTILDTMVAQARMIVHGESCCIRSILHVL